eukprot:31357-Pelagococcus_subviridis.AAC.2
MPTLLPAPLPPRDDETPPAEDVSACIAGGRGSRPDIEEEVSSAALFRRSSFVPFRSAAGRTTRGGRSRRDDERTSQLPRGQQDAATLRRGGDSARDPGARGGGRDAARASASADAREIRRWSATGWVGGRPRPRVASNAPPPRRRSKRVKADSSLDDPKG